MAHRQITHVHKNDNGNITHVGVAGQWRDSVADVVYYIDHEINSYFVRVDGQTVDVRAVPGTPPYLRTDPDRTVRNNLDNLDRF